MPRGIFRRPAWGTARLAGLFMGLVNPAGMEVSLKFDS
jgi:hypothetical protein